MRFASGPSTGHPPTSFASPYSACLSGPRPRLEQHTLQRKPYIRWFSSPRHRFQACCMVQTSSNKTRTNKRGPLCCSIKVSTQSAVHWHVALLALTIECQHESVHCQFSLCCDAASRQMSPVVNNRKKLLLELEPGSSRSRKKAVLSGRWTRAASGLHHDHSHTFASRSRKTGQVKRKALVKDRKKFS